MTSLNLGQPLFLGGFRELQHLAAGTGVTSGLDGAIQRIVVNGEAVTGLARR